MKSNIFRKSKLIVGMALAAGITFGTVAAGAAITNESEAEAAVTKNAWVYDSTNKGYKYYGSDGKPYTGWRYMTAKEGEKSAHWSYFDKKGVIVTGWVQLGKGTANPDGNAAKHWSYFGSNGWLRTGWVQLGKGTSEPDGNSAKHWSYFGDNGWLRTGWQQLGKGTSNPDGNNAKHTSYFGNNGWLVSGTKKIDGKTYEFNAGGWLVKEVTETSQSTEGWASGKASAYGGYTDPGCGSITANGSRVTESSMGVAIPLAWGRRDLLGHKVMINYNGKTVTATINDLGGMGGGSRHLDLQPGVWRAFGFNSCNAWGVRTVKYKIL